MSVFEPRGVTPRSFHADPEMHQTKKVNQRCFSMKVRAGAHLDSGRVHTVSVMPANVSDINQLPHLVREAGLFWIASFTASKQRPLTEANKRFNHNMSSIRARVEHVFRVIKRQFPYTKGGYKRIAKNAARGFSPFGLTDLYLARRALTS